MKFVFLNSTLFLYCFLTNGQQDDWWRNVYINRSSSTMVSSIFCGHNKQQCRKMCFCLPPALGERKGCCPEHQEAAGTALRSAGSRHGARCCTCQTRGPARASLPSPRLGPMRDQGRVCPSYACQHTSLGTPPQAATYSACLIE